MRKFLSGLFPKARQRGQIFLELAVVLPVIVLLIGTAAMLFVFTVKTYRNTAADAELYAEIRIAMERIVEDAIRSKTFVIEPGTLSATRGSRLTLQRTRTGGSNEDEVTYFLRDDATLILPGGMSRARLCRNATNAPVVGGSNHGEVMITKFACRQKGRRLRVELTGQSAVTRRTYSLATEIFFPGQSMP